MNEPNSNPFPPTGYRLLDIAAISQFYSIVDPEETEPVEDDYETIEGKPLGTFWDWQLTGDQEFQVLFGLRVQPTPERPDDIRVTYVGRFGFGDETPTVDLTKFVHTNAPAILFPYIRRAISDLTRDGPFGALNVGPVNIVRVMGEIHPFEDSTGARQLDEAESAADAANSEIGPVARSED